MRTAAQTRRNGTTSPGPPNSLHRFSVRQFQRMIDDGILTTDDRVELLEGWVVEKMTHNPPHAAALDCAHEALRPLLPPAWRLREQKPIVTADSQPEPDLAVVKGPLSRYAERHPGRDDVCLVVEVAESSLADDREFKGRLYARARLPVYWIINLVETKVEVYTLPKAGKAPAYRQRRDYGPDEFIPLVIDGKEVAQVLGRRLFPTLPEEPSAAT